MNLKTCRFLTVEQYLDTACSCRISFVPTEEELKALKVGDNVKVSVSLLGPLKCQETFWVEIVEFEDVLGIGLYAKVANDMENCDVHGIHYGDIIGITYDQIVMTYEKQLKWEKSQCMLKVCR